MNRDPLGESGGKNLHGFAFNNLGQFIDPVGMEGFVILPIPGFPLIPFPGNKTPTQAARGAADLADQGLQLGVECVENALGSSGADSPLLVPRLTITYMGQNLLHDYVDVGRLGQSVEEEGISGIPNELFRVLTVAPLAISKGRPLIREGINSCKNRCQLVIRFFNKADDLVPRGGGIKPPSPGVTVRKVGNYWVKEVDPNANAFFRWHGSRSLRYQDDGLTKLGDLAPAHLFRNGKLITRDAGRYTPGNFWNTWLEGTRRLGTPMNDIRPRNIGADGIIFDPEIHWGRTSKYKLTISISTGLALKRVYIS